MRSIFEISTRGLLSARTATEVTSNNIANANTPGYSRQSPVIKESALSTVRGSKGLGVNVTHIERLRNEQLDLQLNKQENDIGELSEKAAMYRLMETTLISAEGAGLDSMIGGFFDAFSNLSTNPQDMNLRNIVISQSEMMAETFRDLDNDIQSYSSQALENTNNKVGRINELLDNIASLNHEVARSRSARQTNNNALDRQTATLNELAKLVEFDSLTKNDGSVEIRIGGIAVVSGQESSSLKMEADQANDNIRLRLPGGKLVNAAKGELAANIYMFEEGVPEAKEHLNKIATTLIDRVNEVHNEGYGLNGDPTTNRDFFDSTSSNASNMAINPDLVNEPAHIAASSEEGEAGNNDIALEIVGLQSERIVNNQTFANQAVNLMGLAGSKLNEIEPKLETGESTKDFLVNRQEQIAGVSVDEELSNLIRFQNSFQASARVLETGRQMFDTLLSIA
ncbi:MAG: flagellar hook-associated protein FlgK [Balneolales bacterium]